MIPSDHPRKADLLPAGWSFASGRKARGFSTSVGSTWHRRQVTYLRAVADADRRNRYLNGIEYVYGLEVRASIEAEVERLGPAKVMRKLRDSSGGYRGRRA